MTTPSTHHYSRASHCQTSSGYGLHSRGGVGKGRADCGCGGVWVCGVGRWSEGGTGGGRLGTTTGRVREAQEATGASQVLPPLIA